MKEDFVKRLLNIVLLIAALSGICAAQEKDFHAEVSLVTYRDIAVNSEYDWKVRGNTFKLAGFGALETTNNDWSTIHAAHLFANRVPYAGLSVVEGGSAKGTYTQLGARVSATDLPLMGQALGKWFDTVAVAHYVRLNGSGHQAPNQTWFVIVPRSWKWRSAKVDAQIFYINQRGNNFGRYEIWVSFKAIPHLSVGGEIETVGTKASAKFGAKLTLKQ